MNNRDVFEVFKVIDTVEETSLSEKTFQTSPKVDPMWYTKLIDFSEYNQAGPDILCNVMYNGDTGTILSGSDLKRRDGCKRYVCYMPTDLLFSIAKEEVLKDINFHLNERFSLTGSLIMAGNLKKATPVITESLTFRVKLMLKIGQKLMTHSLRYCEKDTLGEFLSRYAMREKRVFVNGKHDYRSGKKTELNKEKNPLHGPLGFFYKVTVDRDLRQTKCNCEYYNTWGICMVLFDMIEFNTLPKLALRKANGVQWEKVRAKLETNVFFKSIFDPLRKEEIEYEHQYMGFFPSVDPQFNINLQLYRVSLSIPPFNINLIRYSN
jgi:hypothetical protein